MATNENVSPSVLNRLIKEVKEYTKNPVSDIVLQVNEGNVTDIRADLHGPAETPYEGGVFRMRLVFGPDFPAAPPKGVFVTPIFHPNVSKQGEICVNTLKKDWKADCKLSHILMVVRCLLIEPNPESALNEEAGRLFMEDYNSYAQRARLMTNIHAVKQGAACSSAACSGGSTRPSADSECETSADGGRGDVAEDGGSRRGGEDPGADLQSPSKVSKTAAAAKDDGDVKSSRLKGNDKKRDLRRL